MQRLARGLYLRRELGQEHRRHRRVLVAHMRTDEIAVRLLAAQHEPLRTELVDRHADPLEAHLQVAKRLDAVRLGDAADHLRRDERLDDVVLRRQKPAASSSRPTRTRSTEPRSGCP